MSCGVVGLVIEGREQVCIFVIFVIELWCIVFVLCWRDVVSCIFVVVLCSSIVLVLCRDMVLH